jgi:hypothetical protein
MTRHDMGGGSMGIPKIHAGWLAFFFFLLPETSQPRYLCNNRRNGWGKPCNGTPAGFSARGSEELHATLC